MGQTEFGLHFAFIVLEAEEERDATEKAKKGPGERAGFEPVVKFSRKR